MLKNMDIFTMLQFFAEGGEGGDSGAAANTGVSPADAGQARLRELGVPESKIRKDRAYKLPAAKSAAQPQQAAAAENKEETPNAGEEPKKLSFDEMLASNEEYKAEFEKRSKESAASVRKLLAAETDKNKALTPAIEVLARMYNMDLEKLDYRQLASAIENDDRFYEDKALQTGEPVQKVKETDIKARAEVRTQREQEESIREQTEREWAQRVHQQSLELKKVFPDFDLQREMQNPAFARMLNPFLGFSVEDAYHHVHRREMEAKQSEIIAAKVAEQIANTIRAGQARPTEAGAGAQAQVTSPVQPPVYDPRRSAEIKKAVSYAKARGQKVYPGMI